MIQNYSKEQLKQTLLHLSNQPTNSPATMHDWDAGADYLVDIIKPIEPNISLLRKRLEETEPHFSGYPDEEFDLGDQVWDVGTWVRNH